MCNASKWSNGYPCRGDDYPACAQGAYLAPEDMPGWFCTTTGDPCCEELCPEGEDYYAENGETDWPEEYYDHHPWY